MKQKPGGKALTRFVIWGAVFTVALYILYVMFTAPTPPPAG